MDNKIDEEKIIKVQLMTECAMKIFEFLAKNKGAKEQVDDFFKEPNVKNMFYLLQDLFLPMATGLLFREKEYIETLEEFPNVKEDIKRHIKQVEKLMAKVKDEGNSLPDTKNQVLVKYAILRDYIENK